MRDQRRLRVVHDHKIVLAFKQPGVEFIVPEKDIAHVIRQIYRMALQRVMESLGHQEEFPFPDDGLPLGIDSHIAHKGHRRPEDFGDAAAIGGSIDVQYPGPRKLASLLSYRLYRLLADYWPIVGQTLSFRLN